MSTPEVIALAVIAAWLSVVSFVLLLLVRQLGLLTVRVEQGGMTVAMGQDGLEVGEEVPQDVLTALPLNGQPSYVLLLSGTCGPCRELAVDLEKTPIDVPLVALVAGADEVADAIVELLPDGLHVVRDPDATSLAKSLRISSTPFAMQLERGTVTGKAYVNTGADLLRLIDAGRTQKELVLNGHA